jgi:UDP-2,4-diacetamido-2,4,6-trideoxy-beta-L-altropyranose hydrolase
MKPVRIALRADASQKIGIGHVKRCLSLAGALQEAGAEVRLVARDLGVSTLEWAENFGIFQHKLATPKADVRVDGHVPHSAWAEIGWQEDAVDTSEALADWRPDWVVVDHYSFDARWHSLVAGTLNSSIAVIDDLADRDLAANLLVDHNYHEDHRKKYGLRVDVGTPIVGGPRFALLAKAYAESPKFCVREKVGSIGIFMGGADSGNMSSLALRACRQVVEFDGIVEIVTTRANPQIEELKALASQFEGTRIVCDLPDLAVFFCRHDLQIGAGGSAAWERCCMGVPTLALVVAENQRTVVEELASLGALRTTTSTSLEHVSNGLRELLTSTELRREISALARSLVDGLGAKRVALRMLRKSVTVRPASIADAAKMYSWRNHTITRSASKDSSEISWDEHNKWIGRVLRERGRLLLVGSVGKFEIGIVRFDQSRDGTTMVSLYLDPDCFGLGLGQNLLNAGEAHARAHFGNIQSFVAEILESNAASCKTFAACGYSYQGGRWFKTATPNLETAS